ncbi:BZ3500_MvSof-1268-A1-R1_Chr2-1g04453 [Microbotryum saponariae]|uniref:BZ3500_MvSof-1268-A1-R1_Chr2-1g04453 protein n=1 Tax=Microbotryum saponariae TaxID=289078 RepID=A0A2X0M9W4_9BASI|nr:BZ3500_MvSof-1268-A1-R1_Chr2-1g04453 [Microbotryum saponariae]SCZ91751.1 BZ3501_MvSof-1269-A2-R1_Chr2-1g04109 [Microbotryum saponariae]
MVYYICPQCQTRSPTYDESMQHYTNCTVVRPANIDALGRPIVPPPGRKSDGDKDKDGDDPRNEDEAHDPSSQQHQRVYQTQSETKADNATRQTLADSRPDESTHPQSVQERQDP